jgi:hypothetical protein
MDAQQAPATRVLSNQSGCRSIVTSEPDAEKTPNQPEVVGEMLENSTSSIILDVQAGSRHEVLDEQYPEGGSQAWLVVLGSWLALFSSFGLMNILGTFQAYLSTHQLASLDEGTIGWIFSVYTFLSFLLGLYIGPIFDKHGPRLLVLAGTVCLFVSLMLFSMSTRE